MCSHHALVLTAEDLIKLQYGIDGSTFRIWKKNNNVPSLFIQAVKPMKSELTSFWNILTLLESD